MRRNQVLAASSVIDAVIQELDKNSDTEHLAKYLVRHKKRYTRYAESRIGEVTAPVDDPNAPRAFPKPYTIDSPINSYTDATSVIGMMVSVLVEEGPALQDKICGVIPGKRGRPTKGQEQGVKQNPFLPEDQSPLSLYAARVIYPGDIPVQPFEHLSAARLLLPHTVGSLPDFERAQLMRAIQKIEAECNRLGVDYRPTPNGLTKPYPEDYLIALPQSGVFAYSTGKLDSELVQWVWDQSQSKAFLYAKKDPLFDGLFASVMEELRNGGIATESFTDRKGMYSRIGFSFDPTGTSIVTGALRRAGQKEAADLIERMALLWRVSVGGAFVRQEVAFQPFTLTDKEFQTLKNYADKNFDGYTILSERYPYTQTHQHIQYACYQILKALTDNEGITDLQAFTPDVPSEYIENNVNISGAIGLILPPKVLPFRLLTAGSPTLFLGYSTNTGVSAHFTKKKGEGTRPPHSGLKATKQTTQAWLVPIAGRWQKQETALQGSPPEDAQDNYDPIVANLEDSRTSAWYDIGAYYRTSDGAHFLPALIAYKIMAQNKKADFAFRPKSIKRLPDDVILGITQAVPTASGAKVGAGRIKPITVTSLDTGLTATAPGLDPQIYEKIKHLIPSDNFKAYKTITAVGGVGEGSGATKRVVYRPLPYQQIGIAFIHATGCRAMIADEMGLGKTIQALGALHLDPSPVTGQRMLPALVICPGSVVINWQNEVKAWLPTLSVAEWRKNTPNNCDVTVVTWGMAALHWPQMIGKFQTIIIDEAHYGKRLYAKARADARPSLSQILKGQLSPVPRPTPNDPAVDPEAPLRKNSAFVQRTLGAIVTAQSAPHAILLTGTPLENGGPDVSNFWSYLTALDPKRYPTPQTYYIAAGFTEDDSKKKSKGGKKPKGRREEEEEEESDDTEATPEESKRGQTPEEKIEEEKRQQKRIEKLREVYAPYMLRRMKNTVTEQINLGCMYIPDYPLSDGGCAGSGVEVFIDGDGQEQEAPESDGDAGDGPIVFNNPRRTRYKKNCGCGGSTRRNIGRVKGQEAPRKGFMRLGVTKTIEYLEIKPTDEQKDLIQTVNKGLTAVIAKAERDRRIKEVVAKVVNDRITRITAIEGLINDINEAFSEKDEESIATVMLAVYYYLRSTAGQIKIQQTIDLLYQTLVKEKEPVIIWAEQKVVIKAIENALNGVAKTVDDEDPAGKEITVQFAPFMVNGQPIKFAVISGSTPTGERAKIVADFQSGKIDLIVASKAMREGVTLTRSCRAIFSEFWWVPAWLMQAEDRIYRIGQKRDCKITYVVLPQQKGEDFESPFRVDGMDETMLSMLRRKRAVTEALLGGEEFKTLTAEEDEEVVDDIRGDEDGTAATTKVIQKNYQGLANLIKETGGKGMEITLEDVLTYLKSLGLKDTYYELTAKGKNPKLVEVTYRLNKKTPAEIRKAKNINVAEGIIIDFINKNGQATNLQLIEEIKNKGLKNRNYLEALDSLGRYLIPTGEGRKLGTTMLRSTLEWMQTTTREIGSTGSFRLQPIYDAIVPAIYPPSKFPSAKVFVDLAIQPLVNQGYVSIKEVPREYKNNPGMQHLDRLIKNMEGPARKAGLPNRMISYAELLKRALDTDNVQDAIDYYADLSTLVGESEAAGIKTPKEVVKTMQTAYAALSRMVDV